MNHPTRLFAVLALCCCLSPAVFAQIDADGVRKKLELADYYMGSGSVQKIEQSDSEQAKEDLRRFRELIEQARRLLDQGQYDEASLRISDGLQAMSAATAALRQTRQPRERVAQRNAEIKQEIQSYRSSFIYAVEEKGPSAAGLLDIDLLDDLLNRAEHHTRDGEHGKSRKLLDEAYQMAVNAVANLRHNDTVVYALDFQTPADEFRYEDDRYKGYEILVDKMVAEGHSQGQVQTLVERFVGKGESLKSEAHDLAARGEYEQAIKRMEDANRSLARALQMMGLPVPGG